MAPSSSPSRSGMPRCLYAQLPSAPSQQMDASGAPNPFLPSGWREAKTGPFLLSAKGKRSFFYPPQPFSRPPWALSPWGNSHRVPVVTTARHLRHLLLLAPSATPRCLPSPDWVGYPQKAGLQHREPMGAHPLTWGEPGCSQEAVGSAAVGWGRLVAVLCLLGWAGCGLGRAGSLCLSVCLVEWLWSGSVSPELGS